MASGVIPGQVRLRDYRYPGEVTSLALTFVTISVLYALAIRFFPSSSKQAVQILVLTVLAIMVYVVTVVVQQRAVFGTLVRVSARQFPELYAQATIAAERLSSPPVQLYVKRASEMNIYTLGLWGRPLIVITSQMVDQMEPGNLQFFIGREIGHLQAGHAWLRALLNPVGSQVPVIGKLLNSVIFGDWVNRAELTADRAGFIACQSLTTAVKSMLKFGVGVKLFEKLDIREFLEQINDVRSVGGRVTEIIAEQPYLTERIRRIVRFALSDQFRALMPEERTYTRILEALPHAFISTATLQWQVPRTTKPDEGEDIPTLAEAEAPPADDNALDPEHLLVSVGGNESHPLRRRQTRLGRNLDNDIVLSNDRVSRYHAEILRQGESFTIVDKDSRNGIWLNGRKISAQAEIRPGDRLRIGKQEFTFTLKN